MSHRWRRILIAVCVFVGAAACMRPAAQSVERLSGHAAGEVTKGEALYQASCIVCHGPRAEGGVGPKLAGNAVLSNDQAFWKVVHEGRHVMPPLKGTVTDQQLTDIRAWLRTLP